MLGNYYDADIKERVKQWAKDYEVGLMDSLDIDHRPGFLNLIYSRIVAAKEQGSSFFGLLLAAQAEFKLRKNIFEAVRLIRLARSRLGFWEVFRRILIAKTESDMREYLVYKLKGYRESEFEEYM